jgi:hypothetical protein
MDFLFRNKYCYTVAASYEATKILLGTLFDARSFDFLKNHYGLIDEEGNFFFQRKYVFLSVLKYGEVVYLKGHLVNKENSTLINISLSPNPILIFIIYALPLVLLNVFFGDNSLMGQDNSPSGNFFAILIIEVFFIALIQICSILLRRKFERAMRKAHLNIV